MAALATAYPQSDSIIFKVNDTAIYILPPADVPAAKEKTEERYNEQVLADKAMFDTQMTDILKVDSLFAIVEAKAEMKSSDINKDRKQQIRTEIKADKRELKTQIKSYRENTLKYLYSPTGDYLGQILALDRDLISGGTVTTIQNSYAALNTQSGEVEINAFFNFPSHKKIGSSPLGQMTSYNSVFSAYIKAKGKLSDNIITLFDRGLIVPQVLLEGGFLARLDGNRIERKSAYIVLTKISSTSEKIHLKFDSIYTFSSSMIDTLQNGAAERNLENMNKFCQYLLEAEDRVEKMVFKSDKEIFNGPVAVALIRNYITSIDSMTDEEAVKLRAFLTELIIADREKHRKDAAKKFTYSTIAENKLIVSNYLGADIAYTGEQFNVFNPDVTPIRFEKKPFNGINGGIKYVLNSTDGEGKFRNHYFCLGVKFGLTNNRLLLTSYEVANAFIDTVNGANDTITSLSSKQQSYSSKEYTTHTFITPYFDYIGFIDNTRNFGFNINSSLNISPVETLRDAKSGFNRHAYWSIGVGFVFNLKNKEKDKPVVDFAIILNFRDVLGGNRPDYRFSDRILFGVKTALPFNTFQRK